MGVKTAAENDEFRQTAAVRDVYSDFNHTFLPHPYTGQIVRRVNVDSVKLAIRNLILTNKYERLRNPRFGCNITRYLFEPLEPRVEREIEDTIKYTIEAFEPRAQVQEIKATAAEDTNSVNVFIKFNVLTSKDIQDLNITLYRVR